MASPVIPLCSQCLQYTEVLFHVECCDQSKTYCTKCKTKILQKDSSCPTCQNQLVFHQIHTLFCFNRENGCNWKGPYKDLETHYNNKCRFYGCDTCDTVGYLKNIEGKHKTKCPGLKDGGKSGLVTVTAAIRDKQQATVQTRENGVVSKKSCTMRGCQWTGNSAAKLQKHLQKCPMRPGICNGCQVNMSRSALKQHRKTCPYVNYSCRHCSAVGIYANMVGPHLNVCPGYKRVAQSTPQVTPESKTGSESQELKSKTGVSTSQTCLSDSPSSKSQELKSETRMSTSQASFPSYESQEPKSETRVSTGQASQASSPDRDYVCPYSQYGCNIPVTEGTVDAHKNDSASWHLELVTRAMQLLQATTAHLEQALYNTATSALRTPPRVFQLAEFKTKREAHEQWFSPSFYSHTGGYKLCLRVDASGDGNGQDTHTSIFVCLMRGEYDFYLQWPFCGEVTVEILNQLDDYNHYSKVVTFPENMPHTCGSRVTESERSKTGFGFDTFVSHHRLDFDPDANTQYLVDDCLFIRVAKVVVGFTNRPWLTVTD